MHYWRYRPERWGEALQPQRGRHPPPRAESLTVSSGHGNGFPSAWRPSPPPSAHQLVLSPAPTPSIQSPIHLQRVQAVLGEPEAGLGAGGHPQLSPSPPPPPAPDNWARDPGGEESTGNFLRGFKGRQERYPRPQIPAPGALPPHTRHRWDGKSPPTPTPWGSRAGNRPGAGEEAREPPPPGRPPDTPPRVPPVPRADLRHHRARSPDMTPSPDPRRPPYLPTPAPPGPEEAGGPGEDPRSLKEGRPGGGGLGRPGAGLGHVGAAREGARRPLYLLILCAKARRSAAAMAPRASSRRPRRCYRAHRPRHERRRRSASRFWAARARRGRAGGGALPGVPGRSVLPLPAGGARVPRAALVPSGLSWGS